MDWRFRPTGVGATAALVSAVAVLSIATGLVNITTPTAGPLAAYVPGGVQQAAGFSGTLTGFVLLVTAASMRRALYVSWLSAVVLLPVTAAQGLVQSSAYSIPLVALSVVATVVCWWNRARFDRDVSLSTSQIAAGLALVGAQIYGTVGTWALREEFPRVETLADAFYFTVVTASTVGYGDITPDSTIGELFALSVLAVGVTSFTAALGALFAPLLEARFATALGRMNDSELELLEDHVVVLGYGDLTEPILTELADLDVDFVVVAKPDNESIAELKERAVPLVVADPSDEEPLHRVHLDRARAVVAATNNDANDALSILTARELRPDANIVAAATDRENVDKLKRAGANTVISPAQIGGHLLVESALGSTDSERIADRLVDGHLASPSDDAAN
ncbi:potassium channel protein [Halorubellus sp. JP-L1]|uniref:NAD-binding protein n=1 Tax=Halorubellus sp. JP-L1 TaxID=2715753 RepID=UPI00140A2B2B|nr:NAD-binding protein [Halorubellus sp. JP-L1]NHN41145.1 potassium channel protein [Halorubellus sp. JP-L1]